MLMRKDTVSSKMIYLNNAATSYPKPDIVNNVFKEALNAPPSSQFRSSAIRDNADIFTECRMNLGKLLGIKDFERIYFASGSTEGLNAIIAGLGISSDRVITTVTEHNSVLRPLYNLRGIGAEPILIPCDKDGAVDVSLIEEAAQKGYAKAVIINHCSNVTGAVQDAESIGKIARQYGLIYILDVSQSAGCIEIKADEWGVDALAFTGHKSLMGPQGTGGYFVREGIPFKPFKYGGTGLDSSRIVYDKEPFEYEVGTQNAAAIRALSAAVGWVLDQTVESISKKEDQMIRYMIDKLRLMDDIHIYGQELSQRGPLISLTTEKLTPSDMAYILQNSFDIVSRAGLHCTPLIHEYIGSGKAGTLRISVSPMNELSDADALINALEEMI